MPSHPSAELPPEQAQMLAEQFLDRVAGAVANGALSIEEAIELHRRLLAACSPQPHPGEIRRPGGGGQPLEVDECVGSAPRGGGSDR